GGVLVGSDKVTTHDNVRILPLQPIWRGFFIDTALYASLWFVLLSLGSIRSICGRIRSMCRRRRHQCERCGYVLLPGQTVCSECGEPVIRS
ncbi:MAG: hypothetical protein L0Y44_00695, partial [Phycisphaerales bacterium]|nr:hypothetical protein [Phycisphaerales bacterium]